MGLEDWKFGSRGLDGTIKGDNKMLEKMKRSRRLDIDGVGEDKKADGRERKRSGTGTQSPTTTTKYKDDAAKKFAILLGD